MGNGLHLLEGTGKGRMDRIVMGKLRMNIDLLHGIEELVKAEGVRTGVILSGVGALKKATFRNLKVLPPDFKVENHHRLYLELERPMEIVSLTGWIATGEDGRAENAFDGDPETIWHSQWYHSKPQHPHMLAIDLRSQQTLTGFRYIPRPTDSPGRIKEFRLYVSETPFRVVK